MSALPRFATLDIGTNSVLLLVAERHESGSFEAVIERAEITRLGRGVDATGHLSEEGIAETLRAVEKFVAEAKSLGALGIAATATSAARDASNGQDFLAAAKARTGVEVELIAGEVEAQLSYAAVLSSWRAKLNGARLVVIDIGGGSTEIIHGGVGEAAGAVQFRKSFDVGSVRLSERFVRAETVDAQTQEKMVALLRQTFEAMPKPSGPVCVVGVAGTVTTLYAIEHQIQPYDAQRVEGGVLALESLAALREKLCALPLSARQRLPGLQPKRADVIPAGALILETALRCLGASECSVSDRGLRWGLLAQRFGKKV